MIQSKSNQWSNLVIEPKHILGEKVRQCRSRRDQGGCRQRRLSRHNRPPHWCQPWPMAELPRPDPVAAARAAATFRPPRGDRATTRAAAGRLPRLGSLAPVPRPPCTDPDTTTHSACCPLGLAPFLPPPKAQPPLPPPVAVARCLSAQIQSSDRGVRLGSRACSGGKSPGADQGFRRAR